MGRRRRERPRPGVVRWPATRAREYERWIRRRSDRVHAAVLEALEAYLVTHGPEVEASLSEPVGEVGAPRGVAPGPRGLDLAGPRPRTPTGGERLAVGDGGGRAVVVRCDAAFDVLRAVRRVLSEAARRALAGLPVDERAIVRQAAATGGQTQGQITRAAGVVGIDPSPPDDAALRALYEAWAKRNAQLITTIDARYLDDVADAVGDALRVGIRTDDLRRTLQARYRLTKARAKLIARDQIGHLNAAINEHKQREVGAVAYRWRTVQDPRVRDTHRHREGQLFLWSDPPPDGHPGQPINCRCVPEPVFTVTPDEERHARQRAADDLALNPGSRPLR